MASGALSEKSRKKRIASHLVAAGVLHGEDVHHLWPDRVELEGELGDDTEVAAAAAQPPEQVGVLAGVGADDAAIRQDDGRRDQVVAGQAVGIAQPAETAAERQAGHAGDADHAAGGRQSVGLRRRVDIAPGRAAADKRQPLLGVDADGVHRAEVDDESVVDGGVAGDVVAAAAYRDRQGVQAGEVQRQGNVVRVRAAGDQRRVAVDHPVPDEARFVVAGVGGTDELAAKDGAQLGDGLRFQQALLEKRGVEVHGDDSFASLKAARE